MGSYFKKRHPSFFLSLPCEDMARRWPSASQNEGPHHNPTMLAPSSQTFSLWNYVGGNVCCLSHIVCSLLLGQPKQSKRQKGEEVREINSKSKGSIYYSYAWAHSASHTWELGRRANSWPHPDLRIRHPGAEPSNLQLNSLPGDCRAHTVGKPLLSTLPDKAQACLPRLRRLWGTETPGSKAGRELMLQGLEDTEACFSETR